MIRFFKYILCTIVLIICVLFSLDFIYSSSFNQSDFSRSKLQYALSSNLPNYDIIVLGSSRANNHIVTEKFKKVNLEAFNFGMSGASLEDSYIILKLILEKSTPKYVLLEIDLNIKNEAISEANRINALPYIKTNNLLDKYYLNEGLDYSIYKNVPFYKYMKFDSRIGFREFFMNTIHKKSKHLNRSGFAPLYGSPKNMSLDISKFTPKKNKFYDKIKSLCISRNINLISFTTPVCNNTKGKKYFNKIKTVYPEVSHLENVVTDDIYFSSCGHMNEKGALIFTDYLINNFFK